MYIVNKYFDDYADKITPILSNLAVELTERCTNNCIHCYINLRANDLKAKSRELPASTIKAIIKEGVSLGCLNLLFTGGEPLLREEFREIYLYARCLGMKVLINTNAVMITEDIAQLFSRVSPLDRIQVTFYGMREGSYERTTRKPGSYIAARKGIDLLLKYEVPFIIKGVMLPDNIDELEEFKKWCSSFNKMDRFPTDISMYLFLRCRHDSEKRNAEIRKNRLLPKEVVRMLTKEKVNYLKIKRNFISRYLYPPTDKLFICGAGRNRVHIDAYGNIQACLLLRHPDTIFHISKTSIEDALNVHFPKMRLARSTSRVFLSKCGRCFIRALCKQCPATSWTENGTIDTPSEYFCEIAHLQARYLGLLKEEETAWAVDDWERRVRALLYRGSL